jgi:hypothetical protein
VKVCGLITLGVWWLLDGLGALGVLGELLEIVGTSRKAWCIQVETHRSGDGEWVLLVSTCAWWLKGERYSKWVLQRGLGGSVNFLIPRERIRSSLVSLYLLLAFNFST